MAKVIRTKRFGDKNKKIEHLKLKTKTWLFRISVTLNLLVVLRYLYLDGHLDKIINYLELLTNIVR